MRNKVLIVDANREERIQLETILQEVVDAGGELFFAETKEDGLVILKKETPQLLFVDSQLIGKDNRLWLHDKSQVIFMCTKQEEQQMRGEYLLKPLKKQPILEKCHAFLSKAPASPIPPM